jgi:hypothetical protein
MEGVNPRVRRRSGVAFGGWEALLGRFPSRDGVLGVVIQLKLGGSVPVEEEAEAAEARTVRGFCDFMA